MRGAIKGSGSCTAKGNEVKDAFALEYDH